MGTAWRGVCLSSARVATFHSLGAVFLDILLPTLLQPESWRALSGHIGSSTRLPMWRRGRSRMRGGHCWPRTGSRPIRKSFARRHCAVTEAPLVLTCIENVAAVAGHRSLCVGAANQGRWLRGADSTYRGSLGGSRLAIAERASRACGSPAQHSESSEGLSA